MVVSGRVSGHIDRIWIAFQNVWVTLVTTHMLTDADCILTHTHTQAQRSRKTESSHEPWQTPGRVVDPSVGFEPLEQLLGVEARNRLQVGRQSRSHACDSPQSVTGRHDM